MDNKDIFLKCLIKAIENGYCYKDKKLTIGQLFEKTYPNYHSIIFSSEFAKAFFGEEPIEVIECYNAEKIDPDIQKIGKDSDKPWYDYEQKWILEFPKWQFHLREMVLEENPLQYLEQVLDE